MPYFRNIMFYVFAYIQIDLQHQRDNEKLTYLLDSCRPGSLQTLFMIRLKSKKQITFEYMIAIYPTYKGGEACNRSRLRDSPLVRRSRAKEGRLGPTVSYGEQPALAGVGRQRRPRSRHSDQRLERNWSWTHYRLGNKPYLSEGDI